MFQVPKVIKLFVNKNKINNLIFFYAIYIYNNQCLIERGRI